MLKKALKKILSHYEAKATCSCQDAENQPVHDSTDQSSPHPFANSCCKSDKAPPHCSCSEEPRQ